VSTFSVPHQPSSFAFTGLDTALAKRATMRLRKVDDHVELWPLLEVKKTCDVPTDYELELTLANDTFAAGSENTANWTFAAGSTNLTIASIVKDSDTQVTVTFDTQVEWPQLAGSGVSVDELNPVMTVDLTKDTFASEATAENLANWTIDVGTSELTVASVTYVDDDQVTIEFTGTCVAGATITVMAEAACLTGGVDSGVMSYDVDTEAGTCTDTPQLVNGDVTFTAKADALTGSLASGVCSIDLSDGSYTNTVAPEILVKTGIDVDDIAPVVKVVINNDAFISRALAESAFTVTVGTTGLTFVSSSWVNERTVDLTFSGTAAAGTIGLSVASSALLGGTAGVSVNYAVDETEWAGSFTQSAMVGKISAYQYLPHDDIDSFLHQYTVTDDSVSYNLVDVELTENGYNPKLNSSFTYDKDGAETTSFKVYGKLITDI